MEVHHHAHATPDLESHRGLRKKWTHYFWEFLMLFLAVFCGFLAENQREHFVEHQREKQYARTLYDDLIADTAALNNAIATNEYVTARIDTFRTLVATKELKDFPSGTWYYFGRFGTRYFHISFQDATIEQLKSSGGLRYFRKKNVIRGIAKYDQARRDLQTLLKFQDAIYIDLTRARNICFNGYYIDPIMDFDISKVNIEEYKQKKFPFLTTNKNDFIQYANLCQLRAYNNKYLLRSTQATLKQAEILLMELKEAYHLK